MFGLGKKKTEGAEKPAKKSSGKKSSGPGFPWKAWLANHGEKIGMGLFVALAVYFVYEGLMTKPFDRTKTPEVLASRSQAAKTEIETGDHTEILKELPSPNDFRKVVQEARNRTENRPYDVDHIIEKIARVSGEKRGDPELLAPIEVQGKCFVGTIAVYSANPSSLDKLMNAPPLGDGRKKRETPTASTPPRQLNPYFDLGFQPTGTTVFPAPTPAAATGRTVRPVTYSMVPKLTIFNAVTAVVPHQALDDNYRKALASATGFDLNRDTPNYLFYEVQRADVTDNPSRDVAEAEWKDAPECMVERQLKERAGWAGICPEYVVAQNIVPDLLTMPVPPILLSDFIPYASHPTIEAAGASNVAGEASESSGESEESGGRRSFSVPVNYGNAPAAPEANEAGIVEELPQALEASTYKLIRFYDFGVEGVGKVYRYRIRLALEDPNYTRAESISPPTIDMKPEVVVRIQALSEAEAAARAKLAPNETFKRNSKMLTPWSEPSEPVSVALPIHLLAGSNSGGLWTKQKVPGGKEILLEQTAIPLTANLVFGEWKRDDAVLVTRKTNVERGSVLSGPPAEPGLDIIHPISKIVKWLTGFKFAQAITIVDIRGGYPLESERQRSKEKDTLPSQTEIIGFDPRTGELIIAREFESRQDYSLYSFVGETAAVAAGPADQ